jgi:hypothetical protein
MPSLASPRASIEAASTRSSAPSIASTSGSEISLPLGELLEQRVAGPTSPATEGPGDRRRALPPRHPPALSPRHAGRGPRLPRSRARRGAAPRSGRGRAACRAPASIRNVPVLRALERLARSNGRDRALIDALVLLWERRDPSPPTSPAAPPSPSPGARRRPARGGGDRRAPRRRAARGGPAGARPRPRRERGDAGLGWALLSMARRCDARGELGKAAASLKERVARLDTSMERVLLLEVAALAAGPLADLTRAARLYEELRAREPGEREIWQPLAELYRILDDHTSLGRLLDETAPLLDSAAERAALRLERARMALHDDQEKAIAHAEGAARGRPRGRPPPPSSSPSCWRSTVAKSRARRARRQADRRRQGSPRRGCDRRALASTRSAARAAVGRERRARRLPRRPRLGSSEPRSAQGDRPHRRRARRLGRSRRIAREAAGRRGRRRGHHARAPPLQAALGAGRHRGRRAGPGARLRRPVPRTASCATSWSRATRRPSPGTSSPRFTCARPRASTRSSSK